MRHRAAADTETGLTRIWSGLGTDLLPDSWVDVSGEIKHRWLEWKSVCLCFYGEAGRPYTAIVRHQQRAICRASWADRKGGDTHREGRGGGGGRKKQERRPSEGERTNRTEWEIDTFTGRVGSEWARERERSRERERKRERERIREKEVERERERDRSRERERERKREREKYWERETCEACERNDSEGYARWNQLPLRDGRLKDWKTFKRFATGEEATITLMHISCAFWDKIKTHKDRQTIINPFLNSTTSLWSWDCVKGLSDWSRKMYMTCNKKLCTTY